MNHGAISVIYLALSAVCLIGLYGVYKPNINAAAGNTFDKVERFTDQGFNIGKGKPRNKRNSHGLITSDHITSFPWNGIECMSDQHGDVEIVGGTPSSNATLSWTGLFGLGPNPCPQEVEDAVHVHFDDGSMNHVKNMCSMFTKCPKLQSVTGNHPGTSGVKDMRGMFHGDSNLSNVSALKSWNIGKGTNTSDMFSGTKVSNGAASWDV